MFGSIWGLSAVVFNLQITCITVRLKLFIIAAFFFLIAGIYISIDVFNIVGAIQNRDAKETYMIIKEYVGFAIKLNYSSVIAPSIEFIYQAYRRRLYCFK